MLLLFWKRRKRHGKEYKKSNAPVFQKTKGGYDETITASIIPKKQSDVMARIQEINVSAILENKKKEILLLKRRDNGFWDLPGGSIEWGESPERAATREAKEETGLTVKKSTLIGISSAIYRKNSNNKHSLYLVYFSKEFKGKISLSTEHSKAIFIGRKKALNMKKLGLNARKALILVEERV